MLTKFLRTSTALAVLSLSAHLLAVSPAKSMEGNENDLSEDWTKFRITWRSADSKKPVNKVVLGGPLFENAKERVFSKSFGKIVDSKIIKVDLNKQDRWDYVEIGWNPPHTRLQYEEEWYTKEQNYSGSQREFAFQNTDSFGSIVYFVPATGGSVLSQFKRCQPIFFENGCSSFSERPIEREEIVLYFLPGWKS